MSDNHDSVTVGELLRRIQRQEQTVEQNQTAIQRNRESLYNGLLSRMRNVEDKLESIEGSMVKKRELYWIMAIGGTLLSGLIAVLKFV